MVYFHQPTYSIGEGNGYVQVTVFLSNPSSNSIAVELFGSDSSATGN